MFGLFKAPTVFDPKLGELRLKGGLWRGSISMCGQPAPLAMSGSRKGPDPGALEIAHDVLLSYPSWQTQIGQAMLEYVAPYAEAIAAGEAEPPEDGMPELAKPGDVWPHVAIEFVQVTPLSGELTVEIGYQVAWDDEHTVGARLRHGVLIELNGSVLPP